MNELQYQVLRPSHPALIAYVEEYVQIGGKGHVPTKMILPRPGTSLVMDFTGRFLTGGNSYSLAISGFREYAYRAHSMATRTDRLVVRFSPCGLHRFTALPLHLITNQTLEAEALLGHSVRFLYEQMSNTIGFMERIHLLEAYLVSRLKAPSPTEQAVMRLLNQLRHPIANRSLSQYRREVGLSSRQLERKVKELVGVDWQTFGRICRFDLAKSLLIDKASSLTAIGYEADYYDQAHFSREFKRIAMVSPKRFAPCFDSLLPPAR